MRRPRAAVFTLSLLVAACGGRVLRSGVDDGPADDPPAPQASASSQSGASLMTPGVVSSGGFSASAGAPTSVGGSPSAGAGGQSACDQRPPPGPGPHELSGEYELVTCGSRTPCTIPGEETTTIPLTSPIRLSVKQDFGDPSHGTVMLTGTGEPLVDNRIFDAEFKATSFRVVLDGPLSQTCGQHYAITLQYDFDGAGPRSLTVDYERSPKCAGNDGHYCVGNMRSAFGDARPLRQQH